MAHKTYKNMFRVRAEITSIGTGNKRVVLPEGWVITKDVIVIMLICVPIARYLVAPLPNMIVSRILSFNHPILLWIEGLLIGGAVAFLLHKKEAAGKSPLEFIGSLLGFFARSAVNSWHDGWETRKIELQTHKNTEIKILRYDERACGSLPARGYGIQQFTLTSAAAVKIHGDCLDFQKNGKRLPPGDYQVVKKRIIPVRLEVRRQPPSLREDD